MIRRHVRFLNWASSLVQGLLYLNILRASGWQRGPPRTEFIIYRVIVYTTYIYYLDRLIKSSLLYESNEQLKNE